MSLRKPHRLGVVLLAGLFCGVAGAVGYRLYNLQYNEHESYQSRADRQHFRRVVLQAERGDIMDRKGRPLAQSTGRVTIYVNPRFMRTETIVDNEVVQHDVDTGALATALAREAGLESAAVRRLLDGKSVMPLAKRIRPEAAERLCSIFAESQVDGRAYWMEREAVRLYPATIAAAVIGFCSKDNDGDNKGIAGIELQWDKELAGRRVEGRSTRSGISQVLEPWNPGDLLAARGNTLVLTLDSEIQQVVEETLAATVAEHNAAAAGAVVMSTRTGAILAMASHPTFDNNRFSGAAPESMRNRILTDPLETGSVAKLFTAAILIEKGHIGPNSMIDCEGGYAVVDGRRLKDSPGHAPLHVVTFRESLRWSSNVGIVKAAQALDNQEWYDALRGMGFGGTTGIDLPGEGSGILYPTERWTKFSRTSLPMGYEMALTPIQIVAAIGAIANGGEYYQPHLVAEVRDPKGDVVWTHDPRPARRILRPTTSAVMREMMQDIVDNGTGKKAIVAGYHVGGKTGTTRKSDIFDRREYIASFAGVLPADEPQLAIYLYVDAPRPLYYASQVAAPAFQRIARAAAVHCGIPPNELVETEFSSNIFLDGVPADEATQSTQSVLYSDRMPSFLGFTMTQARELLPKDVTRVKFSGTGIVVDQFPPPGDPIGEKTEIVLHFAKELALGQDKTP